MDRSEKNNQVINMARLIVEHRLTVRAVAKKLHISKSAVWCQIKQTLPNLDKELYDSVVSVFNYHKSIRHLRGGAATKANSLQKRTAN